MNKLTFKLMNYPIDSLLDELLKRVMNEKITDLSIGVYRITLRTKNHYVQIWGENKWYAWLSEGIIKFNGKEYDFNDVRPKRKTMIEFDKYLRSYYLDQF